MYYAKRTYFPITYFTASRLDYIAVKRTIKIRSEVRELHTEMVHDLNLCSHLCIINYIKKVWNASVRKDSGKTVWKYEGKWNMVRRKREHKMEIFWRSVEFKMEQSGKE